jgi:hypothetical protein
MALNIFGDAPQSLTGLLGEQATEDLRKKAMTTGLINAAIGYIAQPKTGGYGSALPYIGRALMAGQQGAQGVYEGAIADFERQQKIDEFKRKQEQRKAFEAAVPNLMRTTPAQFESVTTPGGYAPQQAEVMPDQVAPNFGMTRLPDVTTQRQVAPARTEFDNQALMNLALQFPDQAAPIISNIKTVRDLNAAPKEDYITLSEGQIAVSPTSGKTLTGKEKIKTVDVGGDLDAQSLADYNKPFSELGMPERQSVINKVDVAKTRRAEAGATKMPPQQKIILEADQKTYEGLAGAANTARNISAQTRAINSILGSQKGSGAIKLSADVKNFLGIKGADANTNQVTQALATTAAVGIRTPGSGSTSDLEFGAYRSVFPTLATSNEGRQLMAMIAEANATRMSKLSDWASKAIKNDSFTYEGLNAYDASLGKAVSSDIDKRVKALTGGKAGSQDLFNQADAIISGGKR